MNREIFISILQNYIHFVVIVKSCTFHCLVYLPQIMPSFIGTDKGIPLYSLKKLNHQEGFLDDCWHDNEW